MVGMVANHTSAGHGDSLSMACFSETQPVIFSIKKQNGKTHIPVFLNIYGSMEAISSSFSHSAEPFRPKVAAQDWGEQVFAGDPKQTNWFVQGHHHAVTVPVLPAAVLCRIKSSAVRATRQSFHQTAMFLLCSLPGIHSPFECDVSCAWKHCNTRNNSCEHM